MKKYKIILTTALSVVLLMSSVSPVSAFPLSTDTVGLHTVGNQRISINYTNTNETLISREATISGLDKVSIKNNIDSISNSHNFQYTLNIPSGAHCELIESDEDVNDQSILIFDKYDNLIAFTENILPKSNSYLNISTTLNGNIVTQKINTIATISEEEPLQVGFTVLATNKKDFSYWFFSGEWIVRDGVESLSLWHKGLTNSVGRRRAAWETVKNKFSSSSKWYNTEGMKDQFMCHADFAGIFKTRWNLEPSRPNVGYAKTVLAGYNP